MRMEKDGLILIGKRHTLAVLTMTVALVGIHIHALTENGIGKILDNYVYLIYTFIIY